MWTAFQSIAFWCTGIALGLFSCAPRSAVWETPFLIAPDPEETDESFSPVGINDAGDVWCVWVQNQDRKRLFARSRPAGGNWGPAVLINSGDEEALSPTLTVDPAGGANLFWVGWDGRTARYYISRHEKGIGWKKPTLLNRPEAVTLRDVRVDRFGNALLIWDGADGGGRARFIEARTGKEIDMEPPAAPRDMLGLQFEASQEGAITAAWYQPDDTEEGTKYHVWTTRYRPEGGWDTPKIVSSTNVDAIEPRLAVARNGAAMIIWRQFNGEFYSIFGSRFDPGIGWDTPTRISMAPQDDAVYPDLAMDALGNTFVVWGQRKCVQRQCEYSNTWARRFQTGLGWGEVVRIAEGGGAAQVAVDGQGNTLVVGSRSTGRLFKQLEIWAREYSISKGWGELMRVESNWANTAHPQLSMNSKGEAIVSWEQYFLDHRTIGATQSHRKEQ